MKNLFLHKKILALLLSVVFFAVLFGVGTFAAVKNGLPGLEVLSNIEEEKNIEAEEPIYDDEQEEIVTPGEDISVEIPEEPILPQEPLPIKFNLPERMMAMTLTPGVDYYSDESMTNDEIKKSIDDAIDNAIELTANTVIFSTRYNGRVLYRSQFLPKAEFEFDILNYAVSKAKSKNLYVYFIMDLLHDGTGNSTQSGKIATRQMIKNVSEDAKNIVTGYDIDAVILDNFSVSKNNESFLSYKANGNGEGYDDYLRQGTEAAVKSVYDSIKNTDPSVQVGLLNDAVWANSESVTDGSDTDAVYESFIDGCADTKKFFLEGYADFIAIKGEHSLSNKASSFSKYMEWWASVIDGKVPFYVFHYAQKACTNEEGWTKPAELSDQVIFAEKLKGFSGSMFDSLSALISNPQQSTDALILYLTENEDPSFLLTQLEMTRPGQLIFSTYEPNVQFVGASHIEFPLYLNGEEISRDENGAFFLNRDLTPGVNTFKFEHKEKVVEYSITRNVQVIKEISPMGNVTVAGGMQLTVSAVAYEGSTLTASLAGQTVTMKEITEADDDTNNESTYKQYTGTLTIPTATTVDQAIGNIVINGSWSTAPPESKTGAFVTVKARSQDGDLIEVITDSAETFPTQTLDDLSDFDCYPLAKGTRDYTDGDEIVYRNGDKTFTYYNLLSGQRVYASDIMAVDGEDLDGNVINGITVSSNSRYTKVIISMDKPVAYVAKYSPDAFTIDFKYTDAVPDDMNLSSTPLFDSATWNGTKLNLALSTPAGFLGYYAYYEGDDLVFRFNNPTGSGSLSGVPIVIDVGHSASKAGALGYLSAYGEYEINYSVGTKLYRELESRGANVYMQDTQRSSPDLAARVAYGRSVNPMIYVSLHCNSSTKSTGNGTEGWYFTRFSSGLARRIASNVASALGTENRGEKIGRYFVTRISEYPAVLVEMGFLSNEDDYYSLIQSGYQSEIASGIADAISSYLNAVGANGNYHYGTEYSGSPSEIPDDPEEAENSSTPPSGPEYEESEYEEEINLPEKLTLDVGETYWIEGEDLDDYDIYSDDEDIAYVTWSGRITGISPGKCNIYVVDSDGREWECAVRVRQKSNIIRPAKNQLAGLL